MLAFTPGNSTCASGFLSRSALVVKGRAYAGENTNIEAFDREQRLIPGISFGCGGWLNKWIVAATEKSGGRRNRYPQLQIWRPSSFNSQSSNATVIALATPLQPVASQRIGLNLLSTSRTHHSNFMPGICLVCISLRKTEASCCCATSGRQDL